MLLGNKIAEALSSGVLKDNTLSNLSDALDLQASTFRQEAINSPDREIVLGKLELLAVCVDQVDQICGAAEARLQVLEASKPGFFSRQSTRDQWQQKVYNAREQVMIVHDKQAHIHTMRDEVAQHLNDASQKPPVVKLNTSGATQDFSETEIARKAHIKFLEEKRQRGRGKDVDDMDAEQDLHETRNAGRRLSLNRER
ncbi:hypothetical protein [Novosphingobium terrae]|uniref:hypothetical protein n=1 Tax=Novosphingobium terrae TaxID=2726189 RepID=UPI0019801B9D|nr:hypothetical protein [Novosphingobium terrae]